MRRVQNHLQGNIKLNPLSKSTEVYCCTPLYRFITCRMAHDSTSTLQAHTTDTLITRTATTIVLQQNMLRGVDAVYVKTLAE